MKNPKLTIVAPVHNESRGLEAFFEQINKTLTPLNTSWELIFVDDGSTDDSWAFIEILCQKNKKLRGIKLSKNYGKDWAIQAGLRAALGDAIVVMDSDLQHPPTIIPSLIEKWQEGYDIVVAKKTSRPDQKVLVRAGATIWGSVFRSLSGISIHNETDFRLVSSRVRDELISRSSNRPFFRGDSSTIGFSKTYVEFSPLERAHGKTTFNLTRLFRLAVRSITSFTVKPLHFVTGLAFITMIIATVLLIQTLVNWITHQAADGFTTVISIILLLGSFQLLGIGIIGEYLGLLVENQDRKKEVIVETQTRP